MTAPESPAEVEAERRWPPRWNSASDEAHGREPISEPARADEIERGDR